MLQCVAVFVAVCCSVVQYVAVYCSVLQYVAVCCSMLQYVAVCVAVCCSVLQCDSDVPRVFGSSAFIERACSYRILVSKLLN